MDLKVRVAFATEVDDAFERALGEERFLARDEHNGRGFDTVPLDFGHKESLSTTWLTLCAWLEVSDNGDLERLNVYNKLEV